MGVSEWSFHSVIILVLELPLGNVLRAPTSALKFVSDVGFWRDFVYLAYHTGRIKALFHGARPKLGISLGNLQLLFPME